MKTFIRYRLSELKKSWQMDGIGAACYGLGRRAGSDIYGLYRRLYALVKSQNGVVVLPILGSKMALRLDDVGLSRTLIRNGIREHEHTQLIHEEVGPNMVGVDLGANLGYYALMEAKLVGSKGRVLAVEPVPENVEILRSNIALNAYRNLEVFQLAIGDANGDALMNITPQSNFCNLLNTMDDQIDSEIQRTHVEQVADNQIVVKIRTLDCFLKEQNISQIDFLRMDIEGYELKATAGMAETFEKAKGTLRMFVEVHNAHFRDLQATVKPWIASLLHKGFRAKAFAVPGNEAGIIRDVPSDEFPDLLCSFPDSCPHILLVLNG